MVQEPIGSYVLLSVAVHRRRTTHPKLVLEALAACPSFLLPVPQGTRFSNGDAHQLVHAPLTHRAVRNVSRHLAFHHGTLGNHAVLDISP